MTVIGSGSHNFSSGDMFGFPGSNLTATYAWADCTVDWQVDDRLKVYTKLRGTLSVNHLIGHEFPSVIFVEKHAYSIRVNASGAKPNPGGSKDQIVWTIWNSSGNTYNFSTSFESGWVEVGNLLDFEGNGSEDATGTRYIYFVGSAYDYPVTNDITMYAVKIAIPSIGLYTDYFPGAVRNGGKWWSTNRSRNAISSGSSAGHVQKRKNSSWVDEKNRSGNTDHSSVFIYRSSSWKIAAMIGSGAED